MRGNKLTKIPVDIGRLTQLRVLNIVNNFLSNLPVTILNLTQLSALWISDNQSQPLMPLQKEFHKESQCYYLTCYLLPQMYTSNSTPTNAASTSTAPDSTYDYYAPPSTCDSSQQNMHIAALENLSLAAISKRKRNICFASDPPQEIAPNLRLMRSPTPYPKELRMMQAKFAANKSMQQQNHLQKYAQSENGTNNLDQQNNTKLLNTMNTENMLNMQLQPATTPSDYDNTDHMPGIPPPMMNNIDGSLNGMAIHSNMNMPNMTAPNMGTPNMNAQTLNQPNMNVPPRHPLPSHNQSHTSLEYNNVPRQLTTPNSTAGYSDLYRSDSRMQTPTPHTNINNDIVQYDSINSIPIRRFPGGMADDTVDYSTNRANEEISNSFMNQQQQQQQQQFPHQPYRSPSVAFSETNSITNENGLKQSMNSSLQSHQSVPMETETNHNDTYADMPQVIPQLNIPRFMELGV